MRFRDDDRGASVQIGAILLFGILILAVATWQVTVVPQENARVEFVHNQRAQDDMQAVRNAIVSAPGAASVPSVAVDLAPEYPPRSIFVNPGSPDGTLRTVGTNNASLNVTVNNATATDGEVDDAWNGTPIRYDTGGLVYEPGYNVYTSAPDTVYENTVLYNDEGGTVVNVSGQALVDGRTVTLVVLDGSLSRTASSTYSVDFETLSASTNVVSITNESGGNVTVSFASLRPPGWWNGTIEESGELDEDGGHVVDVRAGSPATIGPFHNVTLELEGNVTYELRMAKVGVGTDATDPGKHYVVDVAGDGSSVSVGNTQQLVVEVRDRYNNPVSGVTVALNGTGTNLRGGSISDPDDEKTTGSDGRATFEYDASGATAGTATIRFNISDDVTPRGRELVNFSLAVTASSGGGDAYSIDWGNPKDVNPNGPLSSCTDPDTGCTWDVGEDADGQLDLRAATDPRVEDLNVSFHVNNSSVGTLSGSDASTGSDGEANTTLTAAANGTLNVYVTGGADSDAISVKVTNVSAGGNNPPVIDQFDVVDNSACVGPGGSCNTENNAEYDVTWQVSDPDGDLDNVTVFVNNTADNTVDTYTGVSGSITNTDTGDFGDSYEIKIIAKDSNANRECLFVSDTADGSGSFSKSGASSC